MSFLIKRMTVIGVGLMGGSMALGLRERDLVGEIIGVDRRSALDAALELGVIDHAHTQAEEGVKGSSLVVVATPVSAIAPTVKSIAAHLEPDALVIDMGSVKGSIVKQCEAWMPDGVNFVGSHPIAGREHSGVRAAYGDLFDGSRTILTPSDSVSSAAVERAKQIWEAVGSSVEIMDAQYHDRVLAATSHLPHLMAYNVVNTLSDLEDDIRAEVFRYAASGFRDFTRIASSDPVMWRDICIENRDAILDILDRFKNDLEKLSKRVAEGDMDGLYGIFARSRATRARVLEENKILRGE
ncbi:prephenate dehydrogenase [Magnetofaba australis]|uniref:prephenate dehydrogenase n=1 Tax=Magnetofaba australis IT-1 TaxID=1434232 RepID=A0A1Y2K778_9PROT|nr:prephenate dehydrogenase/arogenate dehydrogenase family protein [Magnetofaba australis]OSM06189.1 putative prephenate dehydrogenase [Magnetofaba australis IT-1]